jgi:outer membrane biosynthesis protein TonB
VPVVGSRFLIEAGFIIAVAVIAGVEGLSTWWIIAVVASAWIIVAIVEIVVRARRTDVRQDSAVESSESFEAFESQAEEPTFVAPVRVRVQPTVESRREPEPEPEREPVPAPSPEPSRIAAVPSLPPEPEPEPEPEPVPTRVVAFIPANEGPREWNLWELERAARDHATDDVVRNEERSYLLIYLREFAGPDGILPTDFDGLVRDAFGDVLHTVGA